jgi:hypothetical protein
VKRVLRAAVVAAIVATCVAAQTRGWTRMDADDQNHKLILLKTCPSLESQSSRPPVEDIRDLKTEVARIGSINDQEVFEVLHNFRYKDGDAAWVKRVFVERAADQYCEIYRLSGDNLLYFGPGKTSIDDLGGGKVLTTHAELQGLAHMREDASWTVGPDGVGEVDFGGLISSAFKAIVPKGLLVQKGYGLNVDAMCYLVPIWKPEDPACCGSAGSFFVKFALKGGNLVLTHKEYNPAENSIEKHIKECPIN